MLDFLRFRDIIIVWKQELTSELTKHQSCEALKLILGREFPASFFILFQ
jgi:hypothetical protein